LAYINRRKFATGRFIVRPPATIYVTTLPCEILIATLFMFTYIKQSTYYFGGNNYQFVSKFHEYNF